MHRLPVPQHIRPRAVDHGAGDRGHVKRGPRGRRCRGGKGELINYLLPVQQEFIQSIRPVRETVEIEIPKVGMRTRKMNWLIHRYRTITRTLTLT